MRIVDEALVLADDDPVRYTNITVSENKNKLEAESQSLRFMPVLPLSSRRNCVTMMKNITSGAWDYNDPDCLAYRNFACQKPAAGVVFTCPTIN